MEAHMLFWHNFPDLHYIYKNSVETVDPYYMMINLHKLKQYDHKSVYESTLLNKNGWSFDLLDN